MIHADKRIITIISNHENLRPDMENHNDLRPDKKKAAP